MSVWQIHTIVVLMHFVITPTDPLIAHVNLDIKEMEKTAQVTAHLGVWSNQRMASKALVSVCLFDLFSFLSLTTYFVCSLKNVRRLSLLPLMFNYDFRHRRV